MANATNEAIVSFEQYCYTMNPRGREVLKHSEISLYTCSNVVTKKQGKVFVRRQRKVNPHTLLVEI